jgi:hypothetical protein
VKKYGIFYICTLSSDNLCHQHFHQCDPEEGSIAGH